MVRTSSDGVDGGAEAIAKQRGFTLVRPDEGWFPGLEKLREELAGHQWIFGKTPKFKVSIFTTTCCVQRLLRRFEYFLISSEMAFLPLTCAHYSCSKTSKFMNPFFGCREALSWPWGREGLPVRQSAFLCIHFLPKMQIITNFSWQVAER